jgi:hypothetical protein
VNVAEPTSVEPGGAARRCDGSATNSCIGNFCPCSCGEEGDGYPVAQAIWAAASHLLSDPDGRYDDLTIEEWRDQVTDDLREARIDPATWRWLTLKPGVSPATVRDAAAWRQVPPEVPAGFG